MSRKLEKLGYHGIDSAELVFENYKVSAANLIGGEEGKGFYHAVGGLELGRINVAARGVGIANRALIESVKYSQQRKTFGKQICKHQAIQLKLADMATKCEAARLLVESAAKAYDEGGAAIWKRAWRSIMHLRRRWKIHWKPCAFTVATVIQKNLWSSVCIAMRR